MRHLIPLAAAYLAIYWTCMLGGDVLPPKTDPLSILVWDIDQLKPLSTSMVPY